MEYSVNNKNDMTDLKNAIQVEADDEVNIVDMDAENISDLKDSYVGKYIAQCDICKQLIYVEDRDLTKIEACPYCGFNHCFYLIGQVTAVPVETFVDDLKDEQDEKIYSKAELVYGKAVEDKDNINF